MATPSAITTGADRPGSAPGRRAARRVREHQYLVIGRRSGGLPLIGMRRATSERALAAGLRRERTSLTRAIRLPSALTPSVGLSSKDQAALNEQLGQLLSRGVPLVEALEVAGSVVSGRTRSIVDRMREGVAAGQSFADACEKSGSFDAVTIAIYRAAERTGELAEAAVEISRSIRRRLSIQAKASTVLIYPAVLLTIGFAAGMVMLMFVLPMIGVSMRESGFELPWYTELMVDAGLAMKQFWYAVLFGLAGLVLFAVVARTTIARVGLAVLGVVPAVRTLARTQEQARFFSVMAAMTRSGLPLADALGVGVQTIGDARMRRDLSDLRTRLIRGGVLRNLLERVESVPLSVRRLLIAADRAGDLETAFGGLAEDMTAELENRTSALMALMEPLIIILVFIPIGGMIMSIMVPMLSITSQAI